MEMKILLGASFALNLLLLYLWRQDRNIAAFLHYHFVCKAGMSVEEAAAEMEADFKEFTENRTIWDKLFG